MEKVCIIGRANVGKSTLFNRLIKTNKALVSSTPNLTRDRNHAECEWRDKKFILVDTGGVEKEDGSFEKNWITKNVILGIEESSLILMVVDGKEGFNPLDKEIFLWAAQKKENIIVIVNKIDAHIHELKVNDFYSLGGVSELISVSSLHGLGITDLLDKITQHISYHHTDTKIDDIRVAIVGKPNVGKSLLINKILGEDRVLVSDIPGTTRDSIDTYITKNDKDYLLIDTAGIRRKKRFKDEFNIISVKATEASIARSDIAILMLDATTGVVEQDLRIAGLIGTHNKACILAVNKWDLIEDREEYVKKFLKDRKDLFPFLLFAPVVFISAKDGMSLEKVFPMLEKVYTEFTREIPQEQISETLREAASKRLPDRGKKAKPVLILGGHQLNTKPPIFQVKLNKNGILTKNYINYLRNNIRRKYTLEGTPINIVWKTRK